MTEDLALISLLIAGYALVAKFLDRFSVGSALVFVAIGVLLSDEGFGTISGEPNREAIKLLAELALTLLLFADASTVRQRDLLHDWPLLARLLGIGLMLTIALGTLGAYFIFPAVTFGMALLIGSALAPTDAALGQPVVTNPKVPVRIRRVLNLESGLNDGIATPFVFFAIAIASAEATSGGSWISDALVDTLIGLGAGVAVGFIGGALLVIADAKRWTSAMSRQLLVLALALSCYLVAISLSGNGFIAAFVGGLAFAAGSRNRELGTVRFTESQGSLLAIGVWTAFGLTFASDIIDDAWELDSIAYAVLSLTVIRMLPVAISLVGVGFNLKTVLFIGWFGPRGLASIVFLIIGVEELHEAGVDTGPLTTTIGWTVLFSVILHGLTAGPLATRYGRLTDSLPPTAPELEKVAEPHPTRLPWTSNTTHHDPVPARDIS